ncbi:hypothetical protein [Isoptericola aurantiacus]|uniref:hypothetical protein n=1 Tax=Isoptericola aurantiacus TaxID=3377839 RepID=UPI00383A27EF
MNDKVTSWLRTAVPALWGSAVAWLLARYALPVEVADLLQSPVATSAVVALAIGAWYALWRWLEPHLPAWATRLVLGSNSAPTYGQP